MQETPTQPCRPSVGLSSTNSLTQPSVHTQCMRTSDVLLRVSADTSSNNRPKRSNQLRPRRLVSRSRHASKRRTTAAFRSLSWNAKPYTMLSAPTYGTRLNWMVVEKSPSCHINVLPSRSTTNATINERLGTSVVLNAF